jgi:hypothetical protein
MPILTTDQIKDLAKTVAMINQTIVGFFDNPDNERAYQEWYFKNYGHYEKESTHG